MCICDVARARQRKTFSLDETATTRGGDETSKSWFPMNRFVLPSSQLELSPGCCCQFFLVTDLSRIIDTGNIPFPGTVAPVRTGVKCGNCRRCDRVLGLYGLMFSNKALTTILNKKKLNLKFYFICITVLASGPSANLCTLQITST